VTSEAYDAPCRSESSAQSGHSERGLITLQQDLHSLALQNVPDGKALMSTLLVPWCLDGQLGTRAADCMHPGFPHHSSYSLLLAMQSVEDWYKQVRAHDCDNCIYGGDATSAIQHQAMLHTRE